MFVPEHRSVSFATLRDGLLARLCRSTPIRFTARRSSPFTPTRCSAPRSALARGGYADFTQWTRQRYLTYTQLAIAQHVPVQIEDRRDRRADRRGGAAGAARAGDRPRGLCRHDAWRRARCCAATSPTPCRSLRDAMDSLIKISGSSGLMDDNSVQRCWRDVHAISSHVVMNWDVPAENFGRHGVRAAAQSGLSDVLTVRPLIGCGRPSS